MRSLIYTSIACFLFPFFLYGQNGHELVFPDSVGWTNLYEGRLISFQLKAMPGNQHVVFSLLDNELPGIQFDSIGNFSWTPSYDLVNRIELKKEFPVIFHGFWADGSRVRKTVVFTIHHVNRPPQVEELPVFYVKQSVRNTYQIGNEYVADPDGDPIVFKAIPSQMPEGFMLNSQGQVSWTPSRNQFNALKTNPATIEFIVQDQPDKAETKGRFRVAQTQLDLPPEILIVPGDSSFTVKEDETLNLKLYLSDPNGDDNIKNAGFIASDTRVPATSLKENTPLQYEFTWQPGYEFVEDTQKRLSFELIFFALDKSNNRTQRKINITVVDAENIVLKDGLQYQKYRANMAAAAELLQTLDQNQKQLNVDYKKAKKGKKNRSLMNASLGAVTGLSPTLLETDQSKVVSTVGGTTVLTLNTLEATQVIGKSKDEIMDRIKINVDIRNRVQSAGDEFSRKYAIKTARRGLEFEKDIDKLRMVLNDQRLVLLELDAYRKNAQPLSNKELKRNFPDFTEEN
ncbi:MAG TPA: hypothetical protein PLV21_08960 [Cyclobacteriaceae bacterium]|nr:hypothetical protein [Cyclobacteriaceae bacterium]HRJ82001.1 hypothetical protein [Cyclobacteriaceae bacterium]